MPLLLKKKPKPLTFGQQVKLVRRGVLPKPAVKPTFAKRETISVASGTRQSKFWSFTQKGGGEKHGLSVSSIEKWLDNKEEFRLEKAEGLVGRTGSAAIDFGEWWHWLLGRHYGGKHQRAKNPALDMQNGAKLFRAQFLRDNPNVAEKRLEALELGFLKTAALWPVYLEKFGEEDADKEWLGIEQDWNFGYSLPPITHVVRDNITLDEVFKGNEEFEKSRTIELFPGCIVDLHGIFDGVYRKKGRLWLFETKTKSRIDEAEIDDTMHLDIQVMLYQYAIYRKYKEWPAGVTYNVIRNPQTEPSKKKGETHDAFIKRLEKDVRADEDHYFKRWELEVGQEDIEKFLDEVLDPILRDIQGWAEGHHPHYVHTKALVGKYGRSDYYDVITRGDLTGVDRRPLARKER